MILISNIVIRRRQISIGNVNAGQVRIYKFNSFKAFTDKENEIRNDKNKKQTDLLEEIQKNTTIRSIDRKYLYRKDGSENETYQIPIFEGDVVRLALKDRAEEKADYQLLDEIVYMEIFHNDIMWQIIRDGIMIADKKYILYSATTGQVRNTTITLLREDFFEKHQGTLLVGLSVEYINSRGGMNVGKHLSYTALPLSSSVLPEKEIDIDRCILVKGLETIVTDLVKYVDIQADENGQHYVAATPKEYIEKDVPVEHTDGAGMFLPGELPSSCQIRSGYFKGAMFPFDFRTFAKEIAHNTIIPDAWGNPIDVEEQDIRFLLTTSQLKMWKMYDSWEDYKKAFNDNGVKISVNSYANPAKDTVTFAYQYLQTLPIGCDIKKLCTPAKNDIIRLHTDFEYVKEVMGYTDDSETDIDEISDVEETEDSESTDNDEVVTDGLQTDTKENKDKRSCNSLIAEALNIYPQLVYDTYIEKKIRQLVISKRKNYRAGKLPLGGYYSYVAPDMYAFCEYLFMGEKNPQGLVPKNHVYNKYYDNKGTVEHVVCLRSPHLSRYEYGKRDLVKTEECRRWFAHMESDTVVSCHDLLSKTLQMDWDGDEILVSDDAELYRLAEDLPDVPLYYEMQTAEPQQITKEAIYDNLVKGFDNNVIGDSSNAITKLWNTPETTKDNPIPYDDAINVFCAYSNYAIDYPKTGKSLALGEYEELYNKLVPPKTGKDMFKKSEIKHPNFFIEAKGKKSGNVAKPTKNPMDRIKQFIGKGTGRLDYTYFAETDSERKEFDYRMLMNNEKKEDGTAKYEVDRYDSKYQKLYLLLKHRKNAKRKICRDIDELGRKQNTDATERAGRFETFHYHCVREIKEIFTNKNGWFNVNLAVNYLIDMEYSQQDFATSSKDILWKCFGHILIENLQKNIKGEIVIKFRPRMAYIKAKKGDEELDKKIAQKMESKSVDITQADFAFIEDSLQKYKNGKPHSNDRELLFTLYCMYKEAKEGNRLKDDWLIITQKKHITNYDYKTKKKKKRRAKFNMNKVMEIAGAKSYKGSFVRLNETAGIVIEDDEEKAQFRIKIDIPDIDSSEVLFNVGNIFDCMMYLQGYEEGKRVHLCKVCGRGFVKKTNNQKTCGKECQEELHRLNQAKTNEKNRKTALEETKQAI